MQTPHEDQAPTPEIGGGKCLLIEQDLVEEELAKQTQNEENEAIRASPEFNMPLDDEDEVQRELDLQERTLVPSDPQVANPQPLEMSAEDIAAEAD